MQERNAPFAIDEFKSHSFRVEGIIFKFVLEQGKKMVVGVDELLTIFSRHA